MAPPHPRDDGPPSSTTSYGARRAHDAVPSSSTGERSETAGGSESEEAGTTATTKTKKTSTWLTLARDEVLRRPDHFDTELIDVLRSFGGDDAPGPASLDPDEKDCHAGSEDDVPSLISTILTSEVDGAQADMFARRFTSVDSLLLRQHRESCECTSDVVTTPSLLRLALHRRARQILSEEPPPQPRALRIRALVDFLWSQAQVLDPAKVDALRDLPTPEDLARDLDRDESRYTTVTSVDVAPSSSPDGDAKGGRYVVRHGVIDGMSSCGPVHVNVLRITNPHLGRMVTVDARDRSTDLPKLAETYGATAAISGGYFLYSEPDIEEPSRRTDPVGLLVEPPPAASASDDDPKDGVSVGVVRNPPVFRRAALLQRSRSGDGSRGRVTVERVGMDDGAVVEVIPRTHATDDEDTSSIRQRPPSRFVVGVDGVRCVHRGDARAVDLAEDEAGFSVVGTSVWEVPSSSSSSSPNSDDGEGAEKRRSMAVPLAGFVLIFPTTGAAANDDAGGGGATIVAGDIDPGDVVRVTLPSHPDLVAGMAGGPILLHDDEDDEDGGVGGGGGRDRDAAPPPPLDLPAEDFRGSAPPLTFSQDETFDRNLLPRMGVGLTADGTELVVTAVDGRNLERALGMTLRGTAGLLRALGCTRAMNLDGGSSKRMVVGGRVVDLSTTEIRGGGGGDADSSHSPKEGGVGDAKNKEAESQQQSPQPAAVELSRPVYSAILFLPPEN